MTRNSRFAQAMSMLAFTSFCWMTISVHAQWQGREAILSQVEKTFGDPPGMTRLDRKNRVWADKKNQRVAVDGYIALRAGQLEMLACPIGTKEHESIFAVFSDAKTIHAGLLAVGAEQGKPVKWDPVYTPPTGSEIQVIALWKDSQGRKHSVDTRKWVLEAGSKDKKTLDVNFVFAGSQMWKDPDTGKERYLAESGDLICVSNFSTATLDVPMKSSQANSGLMFIANTDEIPEEETPVRLVLQVVAPKKGTTTTAANQTESTENSPASIDSTNKPEQAEQTAKASAELSKLLGEPK
ncbi:MAG: YdjY domain-containing protein [Pirellulaceae bacterium]